MLRWKGRIFSLGRVTALLIVIGTIIIAGEYYGDASLGILALALIPPVLAVLVVVALIVHFVRSRRRENELYQRVQNGLCIYCGYDLRSSPSVCPECGKPQPRRSHLG